MTIMKPDPLLREAGEALYGASQWQSAMARDLGVADRTVRRWIAGSHEVPIGAWADLRDLMAERGAVLAELRRKLPR